MGWWLCEGRKLWGVAFNGGSNTAVCKTVKAFYGPMGPYLLSWLISCMHIGLDGYFKF